jgi:hypothetical protein
MRAPLLTLRCLSWTSSDPNPAGSVLDYALAITRTKTAKAVFTKEADMGPPVRPVPVYEFAASLQPQLPLDS